VIPELNDCCKQALALIDRHRGRQCRLFQKPCWPKHSKRLIFQLRRKVLSAFRKD